MIRAILFDFYGVWTPDTISPYLVEAERAGPEVAQKLRTVVDQYFHGNLGPEDLAQAFRYNLGRSEIDDNVFILQEQDISPAIIDFMRGLHGHFLKLGVLASLGRQEYELLTTFNKHSQVLEVVAGPLAFGLKDPLLSQKVFAATLQAIGEPPASCLAVSGNPDYVAFAQSLNMEVITYQGFPNLKQELDQRLANETS